MKKKLKIIILIDWYLPGTRAGGPVRSIYSLVNLLHSYFTFYILTKNTDLGSNKPYQGIPSNTLIEDGTINYYYFSNDRLNSSSLLKLIREIEPDLLYCNSFWSYHFSILPVILQKRRLIDVPVLLAPRGMLSRGALGLKSIKKKLYLQITRTLLLYRRIKFHATQEQEASDIRHEFPYNRILVAPNINSSPVVINKSIKKTNTLRLFYLSRIARVKNLHFAISCLKEISSRFHIEFHIYGNLEDQEYWKECLNIIEDLPDNVIVKYIKEIEFNKIQEIITQYNALFLPTLNENYGHSIVESLLSGCPVLISDQTPWTDVEAHGAGYAFPLGNRSPFVKALELWAALNQEQFSTMSQNANNYIRKKIDLKKIITQYKNLFYECVKN